MNETQRQIELVKMLLEAYVRLHIKAQEPGEKSHRLWHSCSWLERRLKELLK